MDDSGAILCQISCFKDMLDQVNEQIEENIQRTREIESEIVRCSELETSYVLRESKLTKEVTAAKFELNGLVQVNVKTRKSVEEMEIELKLLTAKRDDILRSLSGKREEFIMACNTFQRDIINGENEELKMMFSEKLALEAELSNIEAKINAFKYSSKELLADILEELLSANSALELQLERKTSENQELLRDMSELKMLLHSIDPGVGESHR